MMRKGFLTVIAVILALVAMSSFAMAGNGLDTNGAHYNLNIIGVQQDKTADMTGNNGHRIFVPLWGKTNIGLTEGDFQVLDANGTDGKASFQLPNPDPDNDGTTTYSVYARALGKPGGKANMTTCAEWLNPETNQYETICSVATLTVERSKGKPTFDNVTKELLYIYYDLDADGVNEHYNLFNDALENYFWEYDNQGLKVLQLRFYEVPTEVPATMP